MSRLHTEHALRACDVRHVTREDLEQIGTSAEQCSIILELLANPAPAPSAEPSDARQGVPAAKASDDGAIDRTQSEKAESEFDAWLAALHLQGYASMIKKTGMDIIDDAAEVLEDLSVLETCQLRLFEQARFLRAAATIVDAGGDSTRQLEQAAGVGTLKGASNQIGLDLSASSGDIVSWLGTHSLQHLAAQLVADAGLHICDLPHVTDEQLQRAGVAAGDRSAFLLAVSQQDEDTYRTNPGERATQPEGADLVRTSSAELCRQQSAKERKRRLAAQQAATIAEAQVAEASEELAATKREIAETVSSSTGPLLANGAVVLVSGLTRNTSVNGRRGTVVGFDASTGRYVVSLDDRTVKLKPSNLAIEDNAELGQAGGAQRLSREKMRLCEQLAQVMGTADSDAQALLERHGWDLESAICAAVDEDPTVTGRAMSKLGFGVPPAPPGDTPTTMDDEIDALFGDMLESRLSRAHRQLLRDQLAKFAASRGVSVETAIHMMKQAIAIDPSQKSRMRDMFGLDRPSENDPGMQFMNGEAVQVQSLKTHPEYNGHRGMVVGKKPKINRWVIEIKESGKLLSLKRANLAGFGETCMPGSVFRKGDEVEVHSLSTASQYNGQRAVVEAWLPSDHTDVPLSKQHTVELSMAIASGRYRVKFQSGECKNIKLEHLCLHQRAPDEKAAELRLLPSAGDFCGDNTGISFAGLLHAAKLFGADEACTTSDICHQYVRPATVPAGWIDQPELMTFDDAGNDISHMRWYKHVYQRVNSAQSQPVPPAGTQSFCDLLLQDPETACFVGAPTVFLSHAWLYKFLNLLGALEAFVATQPDDAPEVFFWFDTFSIDEHSTQQLPQVWWSTTFREAIKMIGQTVMVLSPWNAPVPLTRAWCLWEVHCSIDTGTAFHVSMGPAERRAFQAALVSDPDAVLNAFSNIDVSASQAGSEHDRIMIISTVNEKAGGMADLNYGVMREMRSWIRAEIERVAAETANPASLHSLARLLVQTGDFPAAQKLFHQLQLSYAESLAGPPKASSQKALAELKVKLGSVLLELDQLDEASLMYSQAIAIQTTELGPSHVETLRSKTALARVCVRLEKLAKARELLDEVLSAKVVASSQTGDDFQLTLETKAELANVYRKQFAMHHSATPDEFRTAKSLFEDAVEGFTGMYSSNHAIVHTLNADRARLLMMEPGNGQDDPSKSREAFIMLGTSLESVAAQLGERHRDVLRLKAVMYALSSKETAACVRESLKVNLLRLLELATEQFGKNHTLTIWINYKVACHLKLMPRPADQLNAKHRLESIVAAWAKKFGRSHLKTAGAIGNLATLLAHPNLANTGGQNQRDRGLKLMREVVAAHTEQLGSTSITTLLHRNDLGHMLSIAGGSHYEEASAILTELLPDCLRLLGDNNPITSTVRENLATVTANLEHHIDMRDHFERGKVTQSAAVEPLQEDSLPKQLRAQSSDNTDGGQATQLEGADLVRTSSAELCRQQSSEERRRRLAAQQAASIAETQATEAGNELAATKREIAELRSVQQDAEGGVILAVGVNVRLAGLNAVELNGVAGVIVGLVEKTNRWRVRVPGRDSALAVKYINIQQDSARFGELVSHPLCAPKCFATSVASSRAHMHQHKYDHCSPPKPPCQHPFPEMWDLKRCQSCGAQLPDSRVQHEERLALLAAADDKQQSTERPHSQRLRGFGVRADWLVAFTVAHDCWDWPTWRVQRDIIKPRCMHDRCRYAQLPEVNNYLGDATVFVSHSWAATWGDTVLAAVHGGALSRFVWLDVFSVRQFPGNEMDLDFRGVVAGCSAVLIAVPTTRDSLSRVLMRRVEERDAYLASADGQKTKKEVAFYRLWCIVEIAAAIEASVPVVVKVGRCRPHNNHKQNGWRFDATGATILLQNVSYMIDVASSQCVNQADYDREMAQVRHSIGIERVNEIVQGVTVGALGAAEMAEQQIDSRHGLRTQWTAMAAVDAAVCGERTSLDELQDDHLSYACYVAASGGREAVCEELVDRYWRLSTHQRQQGAPTFAWTISASRGGHATIVRMLLDRGVSAISTNPNGDAPLQNAVANGHVQVCSLLLDASADANFRDPHGQSMVGIAAVKCYTAVFDLLVDRGAVVNAEVLGSAAGGAPDGTSTRVRLVEKILSSGVCVADMSPIGSQSSLHVSPLHVSCQAGHTEVAQLLLQTARQQGVLSTVLSQYSTNYSQQMCPPLHYAVQSQSASHRCTLTMILLDHGADVAATDVNGETALELATDSDVIGALVPSHVERLMLERVPSPLRQALFDGIQKALQNSARVGDTQTVELLTGLGANGEEEVAAQRAEATLMFLAAQVNDMMVVNALLQAGCDPFVSAGPNGCTTAGVAAENGHAEVLKLILAMPFDKRSVSWVTGPVTSLAVTAQNGHTECVRLLLKAGAAVDGVGHAGITPLVFAVRNGHKEIAHVLLEAGADRSILEGPRYSSVGSTRPSVSEADLQTVMDFTGCDPERARNCLEAAGGDAEQAINIFLGSG